MLLMLLKVLLLLILAGLLLLLLVVVGLMSGGSSSIRSCRMGVVGITFMMKFPSASRCRGGWSLPRKHLIIALHRPLG